MEKVFLFMGVVAGLLVSFLGGVDSLLIALMGFIVIDFLTGILGGIVHGKLNSKVGKRGAIMKLAYFLLVGFAHLIDTHIMDGADYKFRAIAIGLILANEGISIIENLSALGVPIPKKLMQLFETMREKDGAK